MDSASPNGKEEWEDFMRNCADATLSAAADQRFPEQFGQSAQCLLADQ